MGGQTTNVTVLSIEDGIFEVMATSGDLYLGGDDLNLKLIDHCCDLFYQKNKLTIAKDSRSYRRLNNACERVKRTLSAA